MAKKTCAFICGDKETMSVTTLLFPKQRGYATYFACEYGGEAECWKYMEDHGLTLLGFTSILIQHFQHSSRRLIFMQYLIQKDLSSAIAIVVSPKDGTQPIFRITPEGMNVLKQCNEDQDKQHDHITDITI